MKKILFSCCIGLAILLITSCSTFSSFANVFAPDEVSYVLKTDGESYSDFDYNLLAIDFTPYSQFTIDFDSPEFYMQSGLSGSEACIVITYDSRFVEPIAGSYHPYFDVGAFTEARKTELAEYEKMISIEDRPITFEVKSDAPKGETCIKAEYVRVGYAAEYTEVEVIPINVTSFGEMVEMSYDNSTRVYGFTPKEVMNNETFSVPSRGVISNSVSYLPFEVSSIYSTGHEYRLFANPLNYKSEISVAFGNNSSLEVSSLRGNKSITIYSGNLVDCDDYKNGEDIVIRLFVLDKTDDILYYCDFTLPVEDFSNAMYGVTSMAAATSGNINLGAVVNTDVWLDATIISESADDNCNSFRIIVLDPNYEEVYKGKVYVSGDALSGTISTGWKGDTNLFANRKISFTPKTIGPYTWFVIGSDDNGYNLSMAASTFDVTK